MERPLNRTVSPLREQLLAYDPKAKLITSVTTINPGVYRVEYLDTDRVRYTFTYREQEA